MSINNNKTSIRQAIWSQTTTANYRFSSNKDELLKIYEDATKQKFSVLLIDVEADKQERFRRNFKDFYTINE